MTSSQPRPKTPAGGTSPRRRHRITLACDTCRTLRNRCDGGHPACGICASRQIECTYSSPAKRRGLQSGYLRAMEASLEYLLERIPESEGVIHHLLETRAIAPRNHECKRLSEKWLLRRANVNMRRLLDNKTASLAKEGDDAGGQDIAMTQKLVRETPDDLQHPIACLPDNWRRLVDIVFTYTQCWMPILDKDEIVATSDAYPPQGIPLPQASHDYTSSASQAELWAVLALASSQDTTANNDPSSPTTISPTTIFSIARSLVPVEDNHIQPGHIRALLLHSIVLIGLESNLAAWMTVGRAMRLTMHALQGLAASPSDPFRQRLNLMLAACLILNTLASAILGQPTFLKVDTEETDLAVEAMAAEAADSTWTPVEGFGDNEVSGTSTLEHTNVFKTFAQLYKLTQLLSTFLESDGKVARRHSQTSVVTPEKLVGTLDPRFAFCNNVVAGVAISTVPSNYVLRAVFLATAVRVVPGNVQSLLSCLVDVLDTSRSLFGVCGTPAVITNLVGLVYRQHSAEGSEERNGESVRSSTEAPTGDVNGTYESSSSRTEIEEPHSAGSLDLDRASTTERMYRVGELVRPFGLPVDNESRASKGSRGTPDYDPSLSLGESSSRDAQSHVWDVLGDQDCSLSSFLEDNSLSSFLEEDPYWSGLDPALSYIPGG